MKICGKNIPTSARSMLKTKNVTRRRISTALCGCPHFRYCDEGIDRIGGKMRYSLCTVNARQGKRIETETAIHQDCSDCLLPHRRSFILKHFDRAWTKIMEKCEACPAVAEEIGASDKKEFHA